MPTVMSKLLHLGLSLEEVIEASTARPAEAIGKKGEIGTLKPGACGDVAVLKMLEGKFPLLDVEGEGRICKKILKAVKVVRNGEIVY